MPECLHEIFTPSVPGGYVCDSCGEVWGVIDPLWDTWQERIDDANKPSTLF